MNGPLVRTAVSPGSAAAPARPAPVAGHATGGLPQPPAHRGRAARTGAERGRRLGAILDAQPGSLRDDATLLLFEWWPATR
ncbi:hypothetical protein ACWCQZ_37070 [Streptomyces sp. NPDC002285]